MSCFSVGLEEIERDFERLREIREKRDKREDAFLKKGLAKNFQPLRAKRAQMQTSADIS